MDLGRQHDDDIGDPSWIRRYHRAIKEIGGMAMCEESRKRRIIFNFDTFRMTLDTDYISDEMLDKTVEKHSTAYNVHPKRAIVFDLGTQEQDENGTLFFCPQCGQYNQFGWDPRVNQVYKRPKEGGAMVLDGYYKYVPVDCDSCGVFEVVRDDFERQMKILNGKLEQYEDGRSVGTIEAGNEQPGHHQD